LDGKAKGEDDVNSTNCLCRYVRTIGAFFRVVRVDEGGFELEFIDEVHHDKEEAGYKDSDVNPQELRLV